jgi:hypothetical protein
MRQEGVKRKREAEEEEKQRLLRHGREKGHPVFRLYGPVGLAPLRAKLTVAKVATGPSQPLLFQSSASLPTIPSPLPVDSLYAQEERSPLLPWTLAPAWSDAPQPALDLSKHPPLKSSSSISSSFPRFLGRFENSYMTHSLFNPFYSALTLQPTLQMHYTFVFFGPNGVAYPYTIHLNLDHVLEQIQLNTVSEVAWWICTNPVVAPAVTTQRLAHIYLLFMPTSVPCETDFKFVLSFFISVCFNNIFDARSCFLFVRVLSVIKGKSRNLTGPELTRHLMYVKVNGGYVLPLPVIRLCLLRFFGMPHTSKGAPKFNSKTWDKVNVAERPEDKEREERKREEFKDGTYNPRGGKKNC